MSHSQHQIIAGGNEFEILQAIKMDLILSEFRLRHINGDLERIPTDFRENLKKTRIKICPLRCPISGIVHVMCWFPHT